MDTSHGSVHRELLLPTPTEEPPEMPPLVWTSLAPFWLEIHRALNGRVRYALGSPSGPDLESMLIYLDNTRHRVAAGPPIACPAAELLHRGLFARAVAVQRHHHLPLRIPSDADAAGFLLRTLGSTTLQGHDVILQLLSSGPESGSRVSSPSGTARMPKGTDATCAGRWIPVGRNRPTTSS